MNKEVSVSWPQYQVLAFEELRGLVVVKNVVSGSCIPDYLPTFFGFSVLGVWSLDLRHHEAAVTLEIGLGHHSEIVVALFFFCTES